MAVDPVQAYEARKRARAPFNLRPGYEVRVHSRLKEGDKERLQVFEGLVIALSGAGLGKTFTVRRVTAGIGIERIFPMFSPLITTVEVLRATKVRRARLTYLRRGEIQKHRKEDTRLMRKVAAEREAAHKTKEEAEAKERAQRDAAAGAAPETTEKHATEATVKDASEKKADAAV